MEADADVEMKENVDADGGNVHKKKKNFFVGTTKIVVPRANTVIESFMKDGMSSCFFSLFYPFFISKKDNVAV